MKPQAQCANPTRAARAGAVCTGARRFRTWNPLVWFSLAGWLLDSITSVAAPVQQSWIGTYGPAGPQGIFLNAQGNVVAMFLRADVALYSHRNLGQALEHVGDPHKSEQTC